MNSHDPTLDHRARLERAQLEAAERRTRAFHDQRSPSNSNEVRVRVWERLHHLSLPKDPGHNILSVVARQTGLALSDVQEVQRLRREPPPAA